MKQVRIKKRVGYSNAVKHSGCWLIGVNPWCDLPEAMYVEPGLVSSIHSMIGHKFNAKGDCGKNLFHAEVQYDKFVFHDFKNPKTLKMEKKKYRGTFGTRAKFYNLDDAIAWCEKGMDEKRIEATKAYFFQMNICPALIEPEFKNHRLFKHKKVKLIKRCFDVSCCS